tara:strand:- start:1169 stop:1534 length:366 start_codon:yes stop_codon:yes gene_type:complete
MLQKTIICFLILLSNLGHSQSEIKNKTTKIEALTIEITIDSSNELESVFKTEDLDELFNVSEDNEDITFRLNCNFKKEKDKLEGHISYTINGNVNEKEMFIKSIKKIKASALKFYNLKNKN